MSDEMPELPNMSVDFSAACACFNLRKAARAVTSLYDAILQPTGLRSTQATLLMATAAADGATISQLAEHLVMDRTTLARDLKLLTDRELVRVTVGSDRRMRRVHLTDAGRERLRQVIPLWEQAQARLIAEGLGQERWRKLRDELDDVVRLSRA